MERVVLAVILFVCAASAQAQIVVDKPWVRSTMPGQSVAGAFMKIRSNTPVSLVGASSPITGHAEIHESSMEGNVMRMRPVTRIDVVPGKPVELKPGGYHIMLMDIAKPLATGDSVPLRLTFEQAGKPAQTIDVKAEVRDVMGSGGQHGTH
jgi:periplasmic copper chaperone A